MLRQRQLNVRQTCSRSYRPNPTAMVLEHHCLLLLLLANFFLFLCVFNKNNNYNYNYYKKIKKNKEKETIKLLQLKEHCCLRLNHRRCSLVHWRRSLDVALGYDVAVPNLLCRVSMSVRRRPISHTFEANLVVS